MKELIKRIKTNTVKLLFSTSLSSALNLFSFFLLSNMLGVTQFGFLILVFTFIEIIDSLINLKSWKAFIKFGSKNKKNKEDISSLFFNCFSIDFIFILLAFIISYLSFDYYAIFYQIPEQFSVVLKFLSVTLLFKSFDIYIGVLRVYNQYNFQVTTEITQSVIIFLGILFVNYSYKTLESVVWVYLLSSFIGMALKLYFLKKTFKLNQIKITSNLKNFKKNVFSKSYLFDFIIYNNFNDSIRVLSRKIDFIIIGKLLGPSSVAVYKLVVTLCSIVSKLIDPLYQVIYPEIAILVTENKRTELYILVKKITFNVLLILVFYNILFYFLADNLLELMLNLDVNLIHTLSLYQNIPIGLSILAICLPSLMDSLGLVKRAFYNNLVATLIYSAIVYQMIMLYGIKGAIFSYIIYYISWIVLTIRSLYLIKNTLTT
tara:strand:+ start:5429 stop:6721 length:1293 start_codon:yes stop_codon:yes gene_type:complete